MAAGLGRTAILGVLLAGCQSALGPEAVVDGLKFSATARVVAVRPPDVPEGLVLAEVSVRNVSPGPIERTYDGGCFVRRFQAFHVEGGRRRLAWDSRREPNWACTDDLAIVALSPREEAHPHNWGAGVRLSQLRDSLPAGRYEIVIAIQAGDETLRAGFVDID